MLAGASAWDNLEPSVQARLAPDLTQLGIRIGDKEKRIPVCDKLGDFKDNLQEESNTHLAEVDFLKRLTSAQLERNIRARRVRSMICSVLIAAATSACLGSSVPGWGAAAAVCGRRNVSVKSEGGLVAPRA